MKGVLLTILLGCGLYVLWQFFRTVSFRAADHLGTIVEVEIGGWPILGILIGLTIDIGFLIAALAAGKYLLTRLTAGDRER